MTKPAIEFDASDNELRLIYRPRDDTNWVRERFERGDGLLVKGTFHLTSQDLVEDATDVAASAADDDEIPWVDDDRLVFAIAHADGEYFRFKPEVLGFETPVLLHRDARPDWKWFSAERKVSILGVVESLGLERIVIGGPDPDAIPIPEYERLLNQFPTPHELRRYVQARVGTVVRQYTDPAIDAEALLNAYVDKRTTAIAPNLEAPFRHFDVAKYAFALQRLQAMLANETGTSEAQWQLEIVEIILLLNPRYIKAFTEVRLLDADASTWRRIDILLVDASGIRQNAVLNAINDTSKIVGQKVNDPAAMVLAVGRAQSVAQQNASWLNAGKVAEQALPVFRNVIEAITYALFPLLVLLMLLTSGRETMLAFKGYAAVLIWIQLWPPLYAVLNYMASIYAAYDLAAAADLGGGAKALSLQTASTIYSRAISGEAVVGYLAISIPLIAWAALKRMETFGTALVGGLSGLQSMVAGATAGAAAGNLSMGNVSMDQIRLAPNRTSAFMSNWQNDISGNTFSSNMLTGKTAVSLLRNQGYASRVVSMRVSEQDTQDASRQVDAARSEAVAASTERSSVLSEAFSKGLAKLKSSRSSTGSTSSSFEQLGQTIDRLDQTSRSVSESTGLTQSQVARIALGVTGHAGFNARFVGAQLNASADKTYLSGLSADERKVLGALTSEQASEFKQFGDRVSRDSSVASLVATDAREARDLAARIATTTARSARADASLSDRTTFSERVAAARDRGDSISIDIAQDPHNLAMFTRYAEQYGGTSASAQQLLSAELARQSLAPNRNFTDGTGMPASFDEVRHLYTTNREDPRLSQDIEAAHQRDVSTVSRSSFPVPPGRQPTTESSQVRQQVQTSSEGLRAETAARRQSFDDERSPRRTDDGTISPRQSLFKGTARQVAKDAAETVDDTKDALKGIIKR